MVNGKMDSLSVPMVHTKTPILEPELTSVTKTDQY